MRAMLLVDGAPMAWQLMPIAFARVHSFAERLDRSCDADVLVSNLKMNFTAELFGHKNLMQVILIIDGNKIVGHVLLSVEPWLGPSIAILQFELDKAVTKEAREEGWDILERIAAQHGAKYFSIIAMSDHSGDRRRAKVFERAGFAEVGVSMRRYIRPAVLRDETTGEPEKKAPKSEDRADA